ncbi:MAG: LytTR family DNA-binding domain-containing protein [Bacteroidia bacterium]
MRIVILEDEPLLAENLERLVKSIKPDSRILAKIPSVREAIQWFLNEESPDLILADIQLSDGVSFKALEQLKNQPPIIFTTAFDEYALKAFKMNSVDYLLKPIDEDELRSAFEKLDLLKEKHGNPHFQADLLQLFKDQKSTLNFKTRFLVYSGKSMLPINNEQVAYFTKQEIIFLNDHNGKQYVTEYRSLDEVQELINPDEYYRANRQFIVHESAIDRFETDYMGKIHLKLKIENCPEILISKDKAADFKKWLVN